MPINEASGFHRSGLTKQQKREAEAAIYGLQEKPLPDNQQFTLEDIERMRTLVAQHDNAGKIKEFDLNNPPKVPYTHQEYPRVMYHHESRRMKLAHNQTDVAEAEARGWSKEPWIDAPAEPAELDEQTAREVEAVIDARLKKPRKA